MRSQCEICGRSIENETRKMGDLYWVRRICGERCLAEKIRRYWENRRAVADVRIVGGYARMLSVRDAPD